MEYPAGVFLCRTDYGPTFAATIRYGWDAGCPGSTPVACEEGVLAHSALRLMTDLVHVLPGYFSMRYREVTSNVDAIDIFDSTNKYEAGIGIKHLPEFIWVNHNHVS